MAQGIGYVHSVESLKTKTTFSSHVPHITCYHFLGLAAGVRLGSHGPLHLMEIFSLSCKAPRTIPLSLMAWGLRHCHTPCRIVRTKLPSRGYSFDIFYIEVLYLQLWRSLVCKVPCLGRSWSRRLLVVLVRGV